MNINLEGIFLGTRHAILTMKGNGSGSIVNLSSIEGLVGDPNLAAYNASKGACAFLRNQGHSIAPKRATTFGSTRCTWLYLTPMVENYLKAQGDVAQGRKLFDSPHPIGPVGEPDGAYGVLYLASDEAKFVTGTELVIDAHQREENSYKESAHL